jgi:hypothetical protein
MRQELVTAFALLLLLHLAAECYPAKADICVSDTLKVSHLQGHVVAIWSGGEEPISSALVELREFRDDEWQTKFKVTSDEKGFFRVENVPSGRYELSVKADNFRSFGTRLRMKASKANPKQEIIVTLGVGLHNCGSARIQKLSSVSKVPASMSNKALQLTARQHGSQVILFL